MAGLHSKHRDIVTPELPWQHGLLKHRPLLGLTQKTCPIWMKHALSALLSTRHVLHGGFFPQILEHLGTHYDGIGMKPKSKHTIHIGFQTHICTNRLKVILGSIFGVPESWLQVVTWGRKWNFPRKIAWQFSQYFRLQHFRFCIWNLNILMQRIWAVCAFTL